MHLREAGRPAGLVALLLAASCTSGPKEISDEEIRDATPLELHLELRGLDKREDAQAQLSRGRIYERLALLESTRSDEHRRFGDLADLAVLAQAAPRPMKEEAAARLARHFLARADEFDASTCPVPGPLGPEIYRCVLSEIAARFAECSSRDMFIAVLGRRSRHLETLGNGAGIADGFAEWCRTTREACRARAEAEAQSGEPLRPEPDSRKYAEFPLSRHLQEGVRSANLGTAEKAGRGDVARVLQAYHQALLHLALVREVVVAPGTAEQGALDSFEIVSRSVAELALPEP